MRSALTLRRFVVRDDDDERGRTWLKEWSIVAGDVISEWTERKREALVFLDPLFAGLVSFHVGGRVMRRKPRAPVPPPLLWLEYSADGIELLASHTSQEEADENRLAGSRIEGPYRLEVRRG